MTEKKCQLTEKLRNYVYRYGTELSDDKLKKMGTSLEEIRHGRHREEYLRARAYCF